MTKPDPTNETPNAAVVSALDELPGMIRRVRRIADLSQREMAQRARVSAATIARVEAGTLTPRLGTLQRMLAVADLRLVVVDDGRHVVAPMQQWQDVADGADRLYPAHLDTIVDPRPGEWWADKFGLARPPETFRRNRAVRDLERRRSQWEVRVAQHRGVPPPPEPPSGRAGGTCGCRVPGMHPTPALGGRWRW